MNGEEKGTKAMIQKAMQEPYRSHTGALYKPG
jgi:hypothetical protein